MKVAVENSLLQQLADYGDEHSTVEVCGVLTGQQGDEWEIKEFTPTTNITPGDMAVVHYMPDPTEFFQIIKDTRLVKKSADKDFIGIFHTHPNNLPIPSMTDHNGAGYKGIYIIYSPKFNNLAFYYWDGDEDNREWEHITEVRVLNGE